MEEKTTCIFFRSLFDAAERLYKTDPEAAYEIYRSYFRYAFCETEDIESKSEIAELLVRQNVESLNAAERRYTANVKNGQKGKEYGVLGKEYGSLGGRPRKGETREEYWERKRKQLEEEIPPKTPLTIAKAISITEAISNTSSKSLSKTETDSISNTDSLDYYVEGFLDNPSKDFSCITTNIQYFFNRNESDLITLQERIKNKCGCEISLKDLVEIIKDKYVKKISK